jgi:hypothetical protein
MNWGLFYDYVRRRYSCIFRRLGSSIGIGRAGAAANGVLSEKPEKFGICLKLLHCQEHRVFMDS